MSFDNICKYLSQQYPERFATWLSGQPSVEVDVIKTELSVEPIRADFVAFLRPQEQILHLEFQGCCRHSSPTAATDAGLLRAAAPTVWLSR